MEEFKTVYAPENHLYLGHGGSGRGRGKVVVYVILHGQAFCFQSTNVPPPLLSQFCFSNKRESEIFRIEPTIGPGKTMTSLRFLLLSC